MTEQPTPAWAQLRWDQTDPRSHRWAALVPMAAQGWAAQRLGWVLYSTILIGINSDANTLCGYG